MKTGVSTNIIIDVRAKRTKWQNKGKAKCINCGWMIFGYYCDKKKRSCIEKEKPKHCKFYKKK